jgi:hypothetical protein
VFVRSASHGGLGLGLRLGLRPGSRARVDARDRAPEHTDAHAFLKLQRHLRVLHARDFSDDPALRADVVALLQLGQHPLMLFRLLRLRAQHQEVHDREHREHHEHRIREEGTTTRRGGSLRQTIEELSHDGLQPRNA